MARIWFSPQLLKPRGTGLNLEFPSEHWPIDAPGRNRALEITSMDPQGIRSLTLELPQPVKVETVRICLAPIDGDPEAMELQFLSDGPPGGGTMAGFPLEFESKDPKCLVERVDQNGVKSLRFDFSFRRERSRLLIGSIGLDVPGPGPRTGDPQHLEAFGDGESHPLKDRFRTLEDAQELFPFVESLDEEQVRAEIQAVLDGCCSLTLPAGVYLLGERGLALDGAQELRGEGPNCTILRYWGSDAAVRVNSGCGLTTYGWGVRGLTVSCKPREEGAVRGRYGLRIGQISTSPLSAHMGVLDSVRLQGAETAGLHLVASQINQLRDVDLSSNLGDGCRIDSGASSSSSSTDTHFYGCGFRNNRRGLLATGGAVFSFYGCTFELNREEGVRLFRPDLPVRISRNFVFERCYFENNNTGGGSGSANFFIESEFLDSVTPHGIWQHLEIRRSYFVKPGEGNWNIRAGRCQLVVWHPEAIGPIGTDNGSTAAFVTIWDDGPPSQWQIGGPNTPVLFHRESGGSFVYCNEGGNWKLAASLTRNGIESAGALVLPSPDGNRWRVTVDDQGRIQTSLIPIPP